MFVAISISLWDILEDMDLAGGAEGHGRVFSGAGKVISPASFPHVCLLN